MSDPIREAKARLRRQLKAQWKGCEAGARESASRAALDRLLSRPEWQAARTVMCYAPLPDELDLWPLAARALAEGRRLALPRFDPGADAYEAAHVGDLERDVAAGAFGIREPLAARPRIPLNQLDFVLVPGLGFTCDGRRLGRGKGCYDRLLTSIRGTACGVAMDWQVLDFIPAEPHDKHVDCILTPTRWLAVARRFADQ